METKLLRRDVEILLEEYIGQKLRENSFDPTGKGSSTMLDDLAHYDLAISVAAFRTAKDRGSKSHDGDLTGWGRMPASTAMYRNRLQREAMILSSFAGIVMSSLPVEEILALYKCKPAASYPDVHSKASIVCPFTLSCHPLAMLSSYKAVQHSRKHNETLKRRLFERTKSGAPCRPRQAPSSSSFLSSSSLTFLSASSDGHEDS
ncbi:uncharacterized protein C2orf80-like isoform X1 [Entelurus aequoreus]|uniref:uncharacterized protein C2orf80-like isoform X1 n=1 Tax=Entelurus aequoreus TaxID=161455 RepID=UPI002B1E88B6|nr:uncharacterized protein C2orf80-like isoform X1 [Entelurus aequoreus]